MVARGIGVRGLHLHTLLPFHFHLRRAPITYTHGLHFPPTLPAYTSFSLGGWLRFCHQKPDPITTRNTARHMHGSEGGGSTSGSGVEERAAVESKKVTPRRPSKATNAGGAERRGRGPAQAAADIAASGRARPVPIIRFLLYYVVVVGIAAALMATIPFVGDAWLAPIDVPAFETFGNQPAPAPMTTGAETPLERSGMTALVLVAVLLLVLPVAWLYMFTRRLSFDPSLVQSIIILPLVVAGIVIVVKHSLALAFSLAGIVAAVRFRNTLKDPKDAAYIFLTLGIGLSAGVQALDVALIVSLAFNLVVLALWKWDLGAVYSGGSHGNLLAVGNPNLLLRKRSRDRERLNDELMEQAEGIDADGVLIVTAAEDADSARRAVEVSLSRLAKGYRTLEPHRRPDGLTEFEVLVQLRKKNDPLSLLGEIEERWATQIAAAEYVPLYLELDDDDDDDD